MEVQDLTQHGEIHDSENLHVERIEEDPANLENTETKESENLQNSTKTDSIQHESQKTEKKNLKPFRIEDEIPRLTNEDGWLDILGSDDLKKKVIEPGLGIETRPQRGDWIVIDATGNLEDGTEVERYDNVTIIVGDSDIVQGLDLTVALMEKGELAEVVVPARLAYGDEGYEPNIPPNSVIYYKIRLVDVKSDEEINLSRTQRINIADEKREKGNFYYARDDHSTAVHCYRRALSILDDNEDDHYNKKEKSYTEMEKLIDVRIRLYNNLAAAQLKLSAHEAAMKSIDNVLMFDPKNVKALFRKGKILEAMGNLDEAIIILKKALTLEPGRSIIQTELSKIIKQRKESEIQTKAMYRRMFQNNPECKTKSKLKKSWISNWSIVIGGIFTIVCGIVVYKHLNAPD